MTRRRPLLIAGLGGVAALAGAGLAWRQLQPHDTAAPAADGSNVWDLRLARPEGGELVLASLRGRPLLINFWATWCPPCVKELPELNEFARAQTQRGAQGWQVVGIAIDKMDAVRSFLAATPVTFPVGLAGYAATELTRSLGNSAGGLPFTVVYDAAGALVHRKLGITDAAELRTWAGAPR